MVHCLTFSCRCSTLHVSAYMAIFRSVGCFYFHTPEGICFAGFTCAFPSVGWVKYEVLFRYYGVLLLIIIMLFCTVMVCMFFTYLRLFFVLFSSLILLFLFACVCLLVFSCCLSVSCIYFPQDLILSRSRWA
jgi:hypothetical protein